MEKRINVKTEIPGPRSKEWIKKASRYESKGGSYLDFFGSGVHAPVFKEGSGMYITDLDGNTYMDTGGAYASSTLGLSPTELIKAAEQQMETLMHLPDLPNIPRIELAKKLIEISPGELKNGKVQFDVGGGAVMDLAFKIAYYYATRTKSYHSQHNTIAFMGSYHGKTIGANSLTGSARYNENVPVVPGIIRLPFPYCYRCYYNRTYPDCNLYCLDFIRKLFESEAYGVYNPENKKNQVSTLVLEPIQAHLGMVFPPKEFIPGIRKICDDYDITLVFDEICMGIGHTGKWFSCEHWNVVPDIIAISKALSGGVWPLGAVIAKKEIFDVWGEEPDRHMGTYHGNPVGCAAALANIKTIEERKLLKRVEEMGKYFLAGIQDLMQRHKMVGEVVGLGLVLGIEFVKDRKTKEPATEETKKITFEALKQGVMLNRVGYFKNRFNFHPHYTVSKDEIDIIINVLDKSITKVEKAM